MNYIYKQKNSTPYNITKPPSIRTAVAAYIGLFFRVFLGFSFAFFTLSILTIIFYYSDASIAHQTEERELYQGNNSNYEV